MDTPGYFTTACPGVTPLTRGWKLIIALAAAVGLGTWVGLAFLWSALFLAQPGTLDVLQRAPTEQDVLAGDYSDLEREVWLEDVRYLGEYNNSNYFVAPDRLDSTGFCLITERVLADGGWNASCGQLIDGRDALTSLSDAEGRLVVLVPDQFDHRPLEADGWVTVHTNLLVEVNDASRSRTGSEGPDAKSVSLG